ncbi:MAG: xanthine dehydrogenase family protein subunit M [Negativicutes bacterium]|nr:xanthine dehydrogenase family protein subunit M [Negativicutes bacterium]
MQRLGKFTYSRPESLQQTLDILRKEGDTACILAGGTDLLVAMKEKGLNPSALVDIKGLTEMAGIRGGDDGWLEIGALTTLHAIETHPGLQQKYPGVVEAATGIGSLQVRNRATIGGNLCNAAPSADMAPVLIAYQAMVRMVGPAGERSIALEEFFTAPGRTVLASGEVVAALLLPPQTGSAAGAYLKHGPRRAMDIAVAGVGVCLDLNPQGMCQEARIVLGAVAPTPLRAKQAEQVLIGKQLDETLIAAAADMAGAEARPISDIRASAEYRREMVVVLTRRAVAAALARIDRGVKE